MWVKPKKLGVMTLVHSRAHLLEAIFRQMPKLGRVHWQIVLSKPTADVLYEVDRIYTLLLYRAAGLEIEILEAPFSPLEERERFMELRKWQAEHLPPDCDYACIWDDDHILEDPAELKALMNGEGFDLAYATKLFFWDSPKTYTTHIPVHRSVFVYRVLPGDAFPVDRTIHAPEQIHDRAAHVIDLKGRLLDYGYMRSLDRERCWRDYKRVGKIDPATVAIVQPPSLHPWGGHDPYSRRKGRKKK